MAYDESEQNPYWLTEFFYEKDFLARCTIFFSSNFTSKQKRVSSKCGKNGKKGGYR